MNSSPLKLDEDDPSISPELPPQKPPGGPPKPGDPPDISEPGDPTPTEPKRNPVGPVEPKS